MPAVVVKDLCIDAVDPARVAGLWAGLLALDVEILDDGDAVLRDPAGRARFWVDAVPEPPTVKNRVHLDLTSATDPPCATRLAEQDGFTVWADPDGNEFCAFTPTGR